MTLGTSARWTEVDQRHDHGPFDIIGDVHGCGSELETLLDRLGYASDARGVWQPPAGRSAIFVGDLADRGPRSLDALRLTLAMLHAGHARWVPGNHDERLEWYLSGADTRLVYGLDTTAAELASAPPEFCRDALRTLQALPSHYVLDDGRLVVAHTGLDPVYHGQNSARIRHLAAWGVPEGDIKKGATFDERHSWRPGYTGAAAIVYGHTPVPEAVWVRNTIDIDTGCVYGGRLTALRWPEREIVSVPALRAYAERA